MDKGRHGDEGLRDDSGLDTVGAPGRSDGIAIAYPQERQA